MSHAGLVAVLAWGVPQIFPTQPVETPHRAGGHAPTSVPPGPIDFGHDALRPPPSEDLVAPTDRPLRELGTGTTVFVNFDGVEIGDCTPSNSKKDCSWIDTGVEFPPWSGTLQRRVSILQSMRAVTEQFGIRVTGARPDDADDYTMIVYGGTVEEMDALGRAPAGDCGDQRPNEIGFAYLDGDHAAWINGGATTALHEAAHTWGLDHIEVPFSVMAPQGDNSRVYFMDECNAIVSDAEFTPGGENCPDVNQEHCDASNEQDDTRTLQQLFGPPYVDVTAPHMTLVQPINNWVAGPGDFEVEIEIEDDLHPQVYELAVGIEGLVEDPEFFPSLGASFQVNDLPLGTYTFDVHLRDEAGNESSLKIEIEHSDGPFPLDDGCRLTGAPPMTSLFILLAFRRRKR